MKKSSKLILMMTSLLTFLALLIALINRIIYMFAALDNHLGNSKSYYYDWKFGKIHYTKSGAGQPILLIHSLNNGASFFEYSKLERLLSKKYTVYSLDLLGFGKSDKPKLTYTAFLYVQLIHDFISHVIVETPDVISSGKSHAFTTMLASQSPDLVKRLVYINPEPLSHLARNPQANHSLIKHLLELPLIGTFVYNCISSRLFFFRQFKHHGIYQFNQNHFTLVHAFYESSHKGEANNRFPFASNMCKYTHVNIIHALKHINHSIYMIQGAERDKNPTVLSTQYKEQNAAIESSMIHKTKLFPHFENPDAVMELLSIYLN